MTKNPTGFLSYARGDDVHEDGRLTEFRRRLSSELTLQTGARADIFQDTSDIAWGQDWEQRIGGCIDSASFLVCMITPSFFGSEACRREVLRFALREQALGRTDLILPVYYIHCPALGDEARCRDDPVLRLIGARNYVDWRSLRFESLRSPRSKKMFARLAGDIRKGFDPTVGAILQP